MRFSLIRWWRRRRSAEERLLRSYGFTDRSLISRTLSNVSVRVLSDRYVYVMRQPGALSYVSLVPRSEHGLPAHAAVAWFDGSLSQLELAVVYQLLRPLAPLSPPTKEGDP